MIKLVTAALTLASPAIALGASLSEGQSEYERNHVAAAEHIYAEVVADAAASAADRSAAERELARIAWLIDGDATRALGHLDAARRIGDKPCDTAELTARVLRESDQAREAIKSSGAFLDACDRPDKQDAIRAHLIDARLDLAAQNPTDRNQLLADAATEGARLGPTAGPEGSSARLETALLTGDSKAALAAWKDYYWLEQSDAPPALVAWNVTGTFTEGLKSGASVDQKLKLADLLIHAGFAEAAKRFSTASGLPATATGSPVWRRLQAYWQVRDMIEATLLRVNRGLARGKRDGKAIEAAVAQGAGMLMQAAGASGDPREAMLNNYGLVGTGAGTTSGYPSLHLGHLVEDRRDRVTQYGHSAEIRFQSIDNMIGNGFETWLWDGSAGVGGWTANGVIVQVRPRYVPGPLRAEPLRREGPAKQEFLDQMRIKSVEDVAKLKVRPIATLDGLGDRLQLQVVDQVDAVARSKGTDEAGIRRAFLAEYSRAAFDHSIYVHEGRHAIDEALGIKVKQPVLEYRAKLSELALAAYPRLALRAIDRSLEGDGPHDLAGAKIFDQYRNWIEAHAGQITGYDPAVPALAQLDKLSDGQIREIARTLDPLARGNVTSPAKLSDIP